MSETIKYTLNKREHMENNKDLKELINALVKTQLEIKPPIKDKINPRFKSGYSSLDAIYDACRLPLARNGLTLAHSVGYHENKLTLKTTLYHVSGGMIENFIPLYVENQHSQGFASALTYSRRYAVTSLLGLPSDDDDDGEEATRQASEAMTVKPIIDLGIRLSQLLGEEIDTEQLKRYVTHLSVTKNIPIPKIVEQASNADNANRFMSSFSVWKASLE